MQSPRDGSSDPSKDDEVLIKGELEDIRRYVDELKEEFTDLRHEAGQLTEDLAECTGDLKKLMLLFGTHCNSVELRTLQLQARFRNFNVRDPLQPITALPAHDLVNDKLIQPSSKYFPQNARAFYRLRDSRNTSFNGAALYHLMDFYDLKPDPQEATEAQSNAPDEATALRHFVDTKPGRCVEMLEGVLGIKERQFPGLYDDSGEDQPVSETLKRRQPHSTQNEEDESARRAAAGPSRVSPAAVPEVEAGESPAESSSHPTERSETLSAEPSVDEAGPSIPTHIKAEH